MPIHRITHNLVMEPQVVVRAASLPLACHTSITIAISIPGIRTLIIIAIAIAIPITIAIAINVVITVTTGSDRNPATAGKPGFDGLHGYANGESGDRTTVSCTRGSTTVSCTRGSTTVSCTRGSTTVRRTAFTGSADVVIWTAADVAMWVPPLQDGLRLVLRRRVGSEVDAGTIIRLMLRFKLDISQSLVARCYVDQTRATIL